MPSLKCSVIVCSLNGERVLSACLASLVASEGVDFEIIVVDNGSSDSTPELVRRDCPQARLIQTGRNLGFGGGNNVGMQAARGDILVLLNDDTEVPPDCMAKLCACFDADPKIGAAGCKLLYPDRKTIQHAGGIIYPNGNTLHLGAREPDRGQYDTACERDYVTGAALALRRTALAQVGLLDPAFFPIYFEEVDLQRRMARAGWKIWYEPKAWLIHHESQTQGAGSPKFVYNYTFNRLRFVALNGLPRGRAAALKTELAWLVDFAKKRRLATILRAYWNALKNLRAWRADRVRRSTIPRLTAK